MQLFCVKKEPEIWKSKPKKLKSLQKQQKTEQACKAEEALKVVIKY